MSASHDKNPSGFRAAERITLDVRVPISDDDCEMKHSWRNRRTTWHRLCRDYWGTSRLGAVGRVVARMLQIKPLGKPEG
jgi:hypothetical protein